ncbi:MAG: ATP-binding cassette domain-containing protein [Eggerthella lenta]
MIELKNIQVEFSRDGASATAAVDDVSLTILEGEVFGIIGSSGAGKSTLVRTINLLQKPTSGDIVIDGASIVGQTGAVARNALRHRHDLPALQPMECQDRHDNVAFPLKCARWSKQDIEERVVELLEFVNLEEKRDAYPKR